MNYQEEIQKMFALIQQKNEQIEHMQLDQYQFKDLILQFNSLQHDTIILQNEVKHLQELMRNSSNKLTSIHSPELHDLLKDISSHTRHLNFELLRLNDTYSSSQILRKIIQDKIKKLTQMDTLLQQQTEQLISQSISQQEQMQPNIQQVEINPLYEQHLKDSIQDLIISHQQQNQQILEFQLQQSQKYKETQQRIFLQDQCQYLESQNKFLLQSIENAWEIIKDSQISSELKAQWIQVEETKVLRQLCLDKDNQLHKFSLERDHLIQAKQMIESELRRLEQTLRFQKDTLSREKMTYKVQVEQALNPLNFQESLQTRNSQIQKTRKSIFDQKSSEIIVKKLIELDNTFQEYIDSHVTHLENELNTFIKKLQIENKNSIQKLQNLTHF